MSDRWVWVVLVAVVGLAFVAQIGLLDRLLIRLFS